MGGYSGPMRWDVPGGDPTSPNQYQGGNNQNGMFSYGDINNWGGDPGSAPTMQYGPHGEVVGVNPGSPTGFRKDINHYHALGNAAGNRDAYAANYGNVNNALALQKQAAEGNAPSQAQILGGQMTDQSIAAGQSAAASARGGPLAQAAALQKAQAGAGTTRAQGAQTIAALRAQEMAQARNAYGATGLGLTAQQIQNEQFQRGLNQQGQFGWEGLANQTEQFGENNQLDRYRAVNQVQQGEQGLGLQRRGQDIQGMTAALGAVGGSDERMKRPARFGAPAWLREAQANYERKSAARDMNDQDLSGGVFWKGGADNRKGEGLVKRLAEAERGDDPSEGQDPDAVIQGPRQEDLNNRVMQHRFAGHELPPAWLNTYAGGAEEPPPIAHNVADIRAGYADSRRGQPGYMFRPSDIKTELAYGRPASDRTRETGPLAADLMSGDTRVSDSADRSRADEVSGLAPGSADYYATGREEYSDVGSKWMVPSDEKAKLQAYVAGRAHANAEQRTGAKIQGYYGYDPSKPVSLSDPETVRAIEASQRMYEARRGAAQEEEQAPLMYRKEQRPVGGTAGQRVEPIAPHLPEEAPLAYGGMRPPMSTSDKDAKLTKKASGPLVEDAARKMKGSPYSYKDEYLPPEQKPGEVNYGPMAQELEQNPITATTVKKDESGMRMVDMSKLVKAQSGVIAHLQEQIDALKGRHA